jgi:hypothetical protein
VNGTGQSIGVSKEEEHENMGRVVKLLLVANLCLWIYFAAAFAHAAQPYDSRPWGHPPVEPYSFGGYVVGSTVSIYSYAFMKITYWAELPSFVFVSAVMRLVFGRLASDRIFAGISLPGYKLLAVLIVSFLQWYLIGRIVEKVWRDRLSLPGPSSTPLQGNLASDIKEDV